MMEVGHFTDIVGDFGEMLQLVPADGLHPQFKFDIRNNGAEIRVAAAFTIAVNGPLNVGGAVLDRNDGVGNGHFTIIVGMDSQRNLDLSGCRQETFGIQSACPHWYRKGQGSRPQPLQ